MPICFAIGQSIGLKPCNLCLRKGLRTFLLSFLSFYMQFFYFWPCKSIFKTNSNIIFMERSLFKFALLGVMFLISHSSFHK